MAGDDHGADGEWLDLADAIELLRGQLTEAQQRARESQLRFVLGEITAEFEVELVRTKDGSGRLRFGVAEADARRERSARTAQRVTLHLTPELRGPDGLRDVSIGDED
ncbi:MULTISPECIES: trypco2 family protein [Streptomyces]|uniref:Trypco2 family protein n=1 Tax=Streptomyces rochei TaxID=1928 RepID=A0AAX3ZBE0_STRRO|nr:MULTISPECIES: trypco2 family protein [Streptomyces]WDI16204.1 hypothetical protein PS783_00785 [Streptomyces enissocaesilis]KYK14562.1 hypothetical protein AUW26_26465 [Streptomyces sp. CC71]MDI3101554.1 hypothetical protein [Streptomyces sp. AN-3]NUV95750.1 hypothetical protein [Streptomyces sp. KAI 90]RSS15481.1 hypothetical protein EF914_28805 [Streptomyces sp. WAC05458]